MARYHIFNPTPARRIIYDGSVAQHKIQIGPGETKHDVELAPHIAAGFRDGSDGDRSDLWLRPADGSWSPPPLPAGPVPPQFKEKPVPQPDYPRQMDAAPIPEAAAPEGLPPPPPTMPPGYRRYEAPPLVDPVEAAIKADREADDEFELLPEDPPADPQNELRDALAREGTVVVVPPRKKKKKKAKRRAKPKPKPAEPMTDEDQALADMRAVRGH